MGLDPGIRTGVKIAVVDQTGKVLDTSTVYPHEPRNDWNGALATLAALCIKHKVDVIAIGNGTGESRDGQACRRTHQENSRLKLSKAMVSEAGASVYSASELAAKRIPKPRRLLAWGRIDSAPSARTRLRNSYRSNPRPSGVGQYQHDVNQTALARSLDAAVEDCVNSIGVDVNMASAPLLARVAGLNATTAQNIVLHRDEKRRVQETHGDQEGGAARTESLRASRGLLAHSNGSNPLDASAVHPEAYEVVERIAEATKRPLKALIGDSAFLKALSPKQLPTNASARRPFPTFLSNSKRPGRDPRPEFKTAEFKEGVEKLSEFATGHVA